MRNILTLTFLLAASASLWAESLPEWLIPIREAVYEQELTIDEFDSLYKVAKAAARENCAGSDLYLALSRCEYFMGRALQDFNKNDEARARYLEGVRLAEKALETSPGADTWVALTQSLAQACSLGPWTYTVAHGLSVERFAKKALSYDKRNAIAQHHIASRWVYAPAPFHNHKKGIRMMQAILENCDMEKSDYFNACVSIGYAYVQQKKYAEARPWLLKSLETYPTSKLAADLLAKKPTNKIAKDLVDKKPKLDEKKIKEYNYDGDGE